MPEFNDEQARERKSIPTNLYSDITLYSDILELLNLKERSITNSSRGSQNPRPDDWGMRRDKVRELAQKGKSASVTAIARYLDESNEPHPAVRVAAVYALGEVARFKAVQPKYFEDALHDSDIKVQVTALAVLETLAKFTWLLSDTFFIESLLNILRDQKRDGNDLLQIAVLHLLKSLGEKTLVPELISLLSNKDWQVREIAILTLGTLEQELVPIDKLTAALYDSNPFVSDAAILALKDRFPIKEIAKDLKENKNFIRRERAAEILGKSGLEGARKPLMDALREIGEKDDRVCSTIIYALGRLQDRQFQVDTDNLINEYADQSTVVREAVESVREYQ